MTEQAPRQEKVGNEMVPAYVFDSAWQEGNFLIPADKLIRIELRQKLEGFSHYGIMHLPQHQKARKVLLARIAAIDAYDTEMHNSKK